MTENTPDRHPSDLRMAAWAAFGFAIYVFMVGMTLSSFIGSKLHPVIVVPWFASVLTAALNLDRPVMTPFEARRTMALLASLLGWSAYIVKDLWQVGSSLHMAWVPVVFVWPGILLLLWCGHRYAQAFVALHGVGKGLHAAPAMEDPSV